MPALYTHGSFMPRLLMWGLIVTLCVLLVGYVLFQARFLLLGPQITLNETPNTVRTERQVTLSGTASNITAIYLNGRSIVTNENGTFNESLVLQNGFSVARIDAVDRYGRTASIEYPFVYQPNL